MMPRWDERASCWALSTFRTDGMTAAETRSFGEAWIHATHGADRTLRLHCELPVRSVETIRGRALRAVFDDTPPRHVNVIDWPDEPDAQLTIAQELCALIEKTGRIERY